MRVAIDAMGGDHAPGPIVQGAVEALRDNPNLSIVLVGDQEQVEPLAKQGDVNPGHVSYVHTTEVVGMHDSPGRALRSKPNSSINLSWRMLADGSVDAIISAGNTGAVVAGGLMTRRFLPNIQRPGIAVTLPNANGHSVMIDVGANVNPKPEHLFQYGVMGSIFVKHFFGKEQPSIGLLNVGSEESKGNELVKATEGLFRESHLQAQFKGNIEGRDVNRGLVDVIVCEGFVGNVVLKTCEGMFEFMMNQVSQALFSSLDQEKDLAEKGLLGLYQRFHYSEFGGAPLLGIDGVCLISHGASDARAIRNAIKAAKNYVTINKLIVEEMSQQVARPKRARR